MRKKRQKSDYSERGRKAKNLIEARKRGGLRAAVAPKGSATEQSAKPLTSYRDILRHYWFAMASTFVAACALGFSVYVYWDQENNDDTAAALLWQASSLASQECSRYAKEGQSFFDDRRKAQEPGYYASRNWYAIPRLSGVFDPELLAQIGPLVELNGTFHDMYFWLGRMSAIDLNDFKRRNGEFLGYGPDEYMQSVSCLCELFEVDVGYERDPYFNRTPRLNCAVP